MPRVPRTAAARPASGLGRTLLLALLLAGVAAPVWAQGGSPAAAPSVPPAEPAPESLPAPGLPADLGPERPVPTPPPLRPGYPDPRHGLQFGLGLPAVELRSAELRSEQMDTRVRGGKLSQTGVLVHVEYVSDPLRFGYARLLYRSPLPQDTTLDGTAVDRISLDGNQLWGWQGLRPHHSLWLGYGLGAQTRQVRVFSGDARVSSRTESSLLAGLLADWALGPPFSLQLRAFGDLQAGFVEVRAASLQLAFIAAF
jgi:hypothetical protein